MTLTFNRLRDSADFAYVVEGSNDLKVWKPLDDPEVLKVIKRDDYETVTIRDSQSIDETSRRYLRISVEKLH